MINVTKIGQNILKDETNVHFRSFSLFFALFCSVLGVGIFVVMQHFLLIFA